MISFSNSNKSMRLTDLHEQVENMSSQLSRIIISKKDSLVRDAITNKLGSDDWTVEDVIPRLSVVINEPHDIRTICMDGRPIIAIGPVELVTDDVKNSISAKIAFNIINQPKATKGDQSSEE